MWCALHAMTSWVCRAAATFVLPGPQVATTGATPWSSWWTPSVFRARTLAMAALTGRVYHNREGHAQVCPHMPCRCPGQACGFVGSMAALLRHFAAVHRWPCTTEDEAAVGFDIELRDGFNFITAVRAATDQVTMNQHLFLLNMERAPFGRTITAFCIHPFHTSTAMLKLTYECYRSFDTCSTHHQSSEFKVACTDLSNGLPDPSECFLFIVPRSACRDDEEFTKVNVVITQAPSQ
ncbi:hypothetical protein PVAP13_3KG152000 [Panicum virgatum]|nr:hypothetical protein PVAP13_3KG152000 [Panicum virgatum]KAG2624707.1 hypothetical protein PVAP13_3KG152000 [Panicum virgatum]KAG2624709.1 hypothetical protein PVAP13_3KG152000 [Panicum virgatum]